MGYLNKIENPDSMQRVIERLPFPLRQRWCNAADDITNNKYREITFADITSLFELKARVLSTGIRNHQHWTQKPRKDFQWLQTPTQRQFSDSGRRTMKAGVKKRRLRWSAISVRRTTGWPAVANSRSSPWNRDKHSQARTLLELLPTWP